MSITVGSPVRKRREDYNLTARRQRAIGAAASPDTAAKAAGRYAAGSATTALTTVG